MKYFWCTKSSKFTDDEILLKPRIPETCGDDEEKETPRICMSTSILGCLSSIGKNIFGNNIVRVYSCDLDEWDVYRPTIEEVPDVDFTGEVWVKTATVVKLEMELKIKACEDFQFFPKYGIDLAFPKFEILSK